MLTTDEQREIETEMSHYPRKQALSIDAMKIVQKHRGWVSDEALADISALLGLSVTELDSVATFYNLIFRKPVGRHVVYICDSVSCWIMGAPRLSECFQEHACARLGQTDASGRFTLLPIVCLGACDHAPVVMIDDDLHRDVEASQVDGILSRYR
jgi:NADH-quinone oxidoreductase subunit E